MGYLGDFSKQAALHWALAFMVVVIFFATVHSHMFGESAKCASSFDDPNNIRRYQVGLGGESLDERVWAASQKPATSTLTGTRDIPVFFQDYDYEMIKKDGAMSTAREGLSDYKPGEDRSAQADIEQRMYGG